MNGTRWKIYEAPYLKWKRTIGLPYMKHETWNMYPPPHMTCILLLIWLAQCHTWNMKHGTWNIIQSQCVKRDLYVSNRDLYVSKETYMCQKSTIHETWNVKHETWNIIQCHHICMAQAKWYMRHNSLTHKINDTWTMTHKINDTWTKYMLHEPQYKQWHDTSWNDTWKR